MLIAKGLVSRLVMYWNMPTMTCLELGGACGLAFHAETFEEMQQKAQAHGQEMFFKQDPQHMEAMQRIMALMQNPGEMAAWIESKRKEFESRR